MWDRQNFDLIPEVAERYLTARPRRPMEVWKYNRRRIAAVKAPVRLRFQLPRPFILHWTKDEWRHAHDTASTATALKLYFVDIDIGSADRAPVRFTFHWQDTGAWEGKDYAVEIKA
jgi:glucoamylase